MLTNRRLRLGNSQMHIRDSEFLIAFLSASELGIRLGPGPGLSLPCPRPVPALSRACPRPIPDLARACPTPDRIEIDGITYSPI